MGSKFEYSGTNRDLSVQLEGTEDALHRCERRSIAAQYVAALVPEFDYPLETLVNLAYLIEREGDPETSRNYLQQINEQLSVLIAITRDATAFRQAQEKPEDTDLVLVAKSALRLHAQRLNRNRIKVHQRFAEEAVYPAIGGELLHVVSNLVLTSIEALIGMAPHGSLHIRVHRVPEAVRITIADNGGGISADVENLLLNPQVASEQNGSGVGLWLAQRIVRKHTGTLKWRSSRAAGKSGTVFMIFLPCPEQEARAA